MSISWDAPPVVEAWLGSKPYYPELHRQWSVVTEPTEEPVTVAEQKVWSRVDNDDEDSLLEGLIVLGRRLAEAHTWRSFLRQTLSMTLDQWPPIRLELPGSPAIEITEIRQWDDDGTYTVYDADNYRLETRGQKSYIYLVGTSTSPVGSRTYGSVEVIWDAGFADDTASLPASVKHNIKTGIMAWVNEIYETRVAKSSPPESAAGALDFLRILEL